MYTLQCNRCYDRHPKEERPIFWKCTCGNLYVIYRKGTNNFKHRTQIPYSVKLFTDAQNEASFVQLLKKCASFLGFNGK